MDRTLRYNFLFNLSRLTSTNVTLFRKFALPLLKTFNCLPPVLSLFLSLSLSLTCRVNTLVCTILLWSNKCHTTMLRLHLLYRFWLTKICIYGKLRPAKDKTRDQQTAPLTTLMLLFFYTSGTLHARHIRASFELWGGLFCSSLLVSFGVAMKGIQFT